MTRDQVEAGLTNGTLERGVTRRYAKGTGTPPAQGALLMPFDVESIHPPVRRREVVGWLVAGEVSVTTAAKMRWTAPVVGVAPKRVRSSLAMGSPPDARAEGLREHPHGRPELLGTTRRVRAMERHANETILMARLDDRAHPAGTVPALPERRHPGPQAKGRAAMYRYSRPIRAAAAPLLAAMLLATAPAPVAEAASGVPCRVRNVTQGTRDTSFRRMVAAAQRGDRLRVRGTCNGGVTINKDLVIEGVGPDATLSGRGRFRVLDIASSKWYEPRVHIRDIRIIRGRTTGWGGGIRVAYARVTLTDSLVARNTTRSGGGGIAVDGGWVTLRRTLLRHNAAGGHGGGLWSGGSERVTLVDSVVRHNRAGVGGGIADMGGTIVTVIDSSVRRNAAEHWGGGIMSYGGWLVMRGSGVTSNTAGVNGGGIFYDQDAFEVFELAGSAVMGNTAGSHGGGIYIRLYDTPVGDEPVATLADTTVGGNHAGADGGGLYAEPGVGVALTGSSAVTGNDPDDCVGTPAC